MTDNKNIAESRDAVSEETIRQAITLCRDLTNEHGRQLLQVMFEVGGDRLLELASDPKSEEAKPFREAARTLGSAAKPVIENYSRLFLASYAEQDAESAAPKGSFSMGLSLVDEEALEQEILIKRMSSRAAAETQTQFSKLNRRFCFLQNRRIKPADSPLSPQSLAKLMTRAMEPLDVPDAVSRVLFNALEQEYANALGYLYSEINEVLIDLGILPDIKHHVWRAEVSTRSRSRAGLTESQRKALEELHRPEDDELQELLTGIAKSEAGLSTGGAAPTAATFRREAEQLTGLLQELAESGNARVGSLLDSLDQLAEQTQGAKPSGTARAVLQQADGLAAQFLKPFTHRADSREAYLAGKIAAPLARLAVEDPSLVVNEQHALRLAVKELGSYADYIQASDPAVRQGVMEEFEDLADGFALLDFQEPEAIVSYTTNLSRRSALMKLDFKEQVQRLGQLEEGRTRLARAQRSILQMLKKALVGHRFPEPALEFLLGKWSNVLVHCYLNSETDAPSWQAARSVTDKLVILIPELEQGIPQARQAEFGALLKNLWNQLVKHAGYRGSPSDLLAELGLQEPAMANQLSDEARASLAPLLGTAGAAWTLIEADNPRLQAAESQLPRVPVQSEKAYQLWKDRLRPGTWVEFTEGDLTTRCRLMKVFGDGERCIFVDGLGRLTRSLNAMEVLEQVKQGKLKKTA